MTAATAEFSDLSGKKFTVSASIARGGLLNRLVHERGVRSFGRRLVDAGFVHIGDLHDRPIDDILREVPTTRANLNRVLGYLCVQGVELI